VVDSRSENRRSSNVKPGTQVVSETQDF
jgi:hypothetical protein